MTRCVRRSQTKATTPEVFTEISSAQRTASAAFGNVFPTATSRVANRNYSKESNLGRLPALLLLGLAALSSCGFKENDPELEEALEWSRGFKEDHPEVARELVAKK